MHTIFIVCTTKIVRNNLCLGFEKIVSCMDDFNLAIEMHETHRNRGFHRTLIVDMFFTDFFAFSPKYDRHSKNPPFLYEVNIACRRNWREIKSIRSPAAAHCCNTGTVYTRTKDYTAGMDMRVLRNGFGQKSARMRHFRGIVEQLRFTYLINGRFRQVQANCAAQNSTQSFL